jgi:hypothetical protein
MTELCRIDVDRKVKLAGFILFDTDATNPILLE